MLQNKSSFLYGLLFFSLIFLGMAALFIVTGPWGLGVSEDSVHYLSGARGLLNGQGYRSDLRNEPITYFPPLFSFLTACIGSILKLDALHAARILQILLFGVNAALVGYFLKQITGSAKISLIGVWLMLTSNAMFNVHSMAWSEPLFFSFLFPGFYCLHRYFENEKKQYLIFAAALIALASLVRYAGVSVISTGLVMILLFHPRGFAARAKDGLIFFVVSYLPSALWFVRNLLTAGELANRDLGFHVPSSRYFNQAMNTISTWILPEEIPPSIRHFVFRVILLALLGLFLFLVFKKSKGQAAGILANHPSFRFVVSMIIFVIFNAGLLIVHLFLMNVNTQANDRHFSPFYVACLMSALIVLTEWLKVSLHPKILKSAFVFLLVAVTSFNLFAFQRNWIEMYRNGKAFTSRQWKTSPTLARVSTLPEKVLIYSNDPSIIYINTGRPAARLPRKFNKQHTRRGEEAKPAKTYFPRIANVKRRLESREGFVVFFLDRHRWYNASQEDLEALLPIQMMETLQDGVIYKTKE